MFRGTLTGHVNWRLGYAAFTLFVGVGCGGAREPEVTSPGGARQAPPAAEPVGAGEPGAAGAEAISSGETDGGPPAPDRLRPLRASTLLEGVRQAGLDPSRLEPWERVPLRARLKLMDVFSEALGVPCTGCHVSTSDYRGETRQKQVTRRMWDEFVVPQRLGAEPLFCDSCHQGSAEVLDRGKPEAVEAYMEAEYHGRLRLRDGGVVECSTCHGESFEPSIIGERWGIQAERGVAHD